jgi:uncharacterized protein (DUF1919 family)
MFSISSFAQNESVIIENLSTKADIILIGKVTQKESSWNSSKTRIYTTATVEVEEYLKGNIGESYVEVVYPGGEVGDIGELYTHMPRFEDNEEVFVFLKERGKDNKYEVLNGEEGKITFLEDVKTKEKVTASKIPIKQIKSQIKRLLDKQ